MVILLAVGANLVCKFPTLITSIEFESAIEHQKEIIVVYDPKVEIIIPEDWAALDVNNVLISRHNWIPYTSYFTEECAKSIMQIFNTSRVQEPISVCFPVIS